MSYKKDTSESADSGDSTETGEYEDDFEKDLEWLINEEEKGISDDTQVLRKCCIFLSCVSS